jgi:hypothetical protein
MPTKVTDTILPTTMIGSYPKPRWYQQYNLAGEDLLEWWKLEENWHAYWDATTACIKDQELAGLDILTDGQMHSTSTGAASGRSSGTGTSASAASRRPSSPTRSRRRTDLRAAARSARRSAGRRGRRGS